MCQVSECWDEGIRVLALYTVLTCVEGGRFGVLRQVSVKLTVFWDVMPLDLVHC